MNSRVASIAACVVIALLGFSAIAAWPHAELDAVTPDTAEPGLLLVIGLALVLAGQLSRVPTLTNDEADMSRPSNAISNLAAGD